MACRETGACIGYADAAAGGRAYRLKGADVLALHAESLTFTRLALLLAAARRQTRALILFSFGTTC